MAKERSLPPKRFLLILLPALFFVSFFLIRGNDIARRVPLLTPTIASLTCRTANPSSPIFDSKPYGIIKKGATGIAFFQTYGNFGECTMSFLNGSWRSHAHLTASSTKARAIVVGIYGAQEPDPGRIIVGGRVEPSVTNLLAVLPNGRKVPIDIRHDLFYAWISDTGSSRTAAAAPVLLGTDSQGKVIDSMKLRSRIPSST
jgi:hypothetical protein